MSAVIIVAGATMVSCSGKTSGSDSSDSTKTSVSTSTSDSSDIEGKAMDYAERMAEAAQSKDVETLKQLQQEQQEWLETFSQEDQFKVADAIHKAQREVRKKH